MSHDGLGEDTLADKIVRFVIGALLGAGAGWLLVNRIGSMTDGGYITTVLVGAGVVGLLATFGGNRFIEAFIHRAWWS
jgi:hypothetical protein